MLYRDLGKTGGTVSTIGLGTWAIGGTQWGGTDEKAAVEAIHTALDGGVNLIDTAPFYGFGLAEELIARALKGRDRSRVIISDKYGLTWETNEGENFRDIAGKTVYKNLRPASLHAEVEASLRRLNTDYLDVCVINIYDPTTPVEETMNELLRLRDVGKIRAIGAANMTLAQLHQFLDLGQIDVIQHLYHLLDRRLEREVLPFCREHGISVFAYSPLAQGLLTGTLAENVEFPMGDMRAHDPRFARRTIASTNALIAQLATMRKKYDLDQAQLAIAWAISRPGVTSALVGARSAWQASDNLDGSVVIDPEDLATIDRIVDEQAGEKGIPYAA